MVEADSPVVMVTVGSGLAAFVIAGTDDMVAGDTVLHSVLVDAGDAVTLWSVEEGVTFSVTTAVDTTVESRVCVTGSVTVAGTLAASVEPPSTRVTE